MAEDHKRSRGRPRFAEGEARSLMVKIRVSEAERSTLEAGAELRGQSVSDMLRAAGLRLAARAIKRGG